MREATRDTPSPRTRQRLCALVVGERERDASADASSFAENWSSGAAGGFRAPQTGREVSGEAPRVSLSPWGPSGQLRAGLASAPGRCQRARPGQAPGGGRRPAEVSGRREGGRCPCLPAAPGRVRGELCQTRPLLLGREVGRQAAKYLSGPPQPGSRGGVPPPLSPSSCWAF